MALTRLNLPGTYEFFTLDDARRAADEDKLRPGSVVVVDGRTYLALYYDTEKRTVLIKSPGTIPPANIDVTLPERFAYLIEGERRRRPRRTGKYR
jgi:hypothetical protein